MSSLQKRKRDSNHPDQDQGLANAGFCSTPKKIVINCYAERTPAKACDAVIKSSKQIAINPYEVLRKPSKKISTHFETCFENPALNLDGPERRLNPFEVLRRDASASPKKENPQGFINEGLNVKFSEDYNLNPFEVQREQVVRHVKGFETETRSQLLQPSNYKIALPFAPNKACRIDFTNISLSQLTPSKTMISDERLVFSPVIAPSKRSLLGGAVSEVSEESTVSIGRELDRYQLELENSMNEAKQGQSNALKQNNCNIFRKNSECYQELLFPLEKLEHIEEIEDAEELIVDTQTSNDTRDDVDEPTPLPSMGEKSFEENFLNNPLPFKRVYRSAQSPTQLIEKRASGKGTKKILLGDAIRRSIRKYTATDHRSKKQINNPNTRMGQTFSEDPNPSFFNSIRRSLRRKNITQTYKESSEHPTLKSNVENSIIYMEKTRIKFKSNILEAEQMETGKKSSINILSQSTKDLVNSVLRLKHQQYDLN